MNFSSFIAWIMSHVRSLYTLMGTSSFICTPPQWAVKAHVLAGLTLFSHPYICIISLSAVEVSRIILTIELLFAFLFVHTPLIPIRYMRITSSQAVRTALRVKPFSNLFYLLLKFISLTLLHWRTSHVMIYPERPFAVREVLWSPCMLRVGGRAPARPAS